jgi:hypothetical protein
MHIYTIYCMHSIYGWSQPCLTLLTSCTLITYNNYITTKINSITNQWLLCNKSIAFNNTYDHAMCIHFHRPIYMTFQLDASSMQVIKLKIWNLKIWNLGGNPLIKWHMAVYQHLCPNASTTFKCLCLLSRNLRWFS